MPVSRRKTGTAAKSRGDRQIFKHSGFKLGAFNEKLYHNPGEIVKGPVPGVWVDPLDCPVCMEPLIDEETVVEPNCRNVFHRSCLEQTRLALGTCPVCRARLQDTSLKDKLLDAIRQNDTDNVTLLIAQNYLESGTQDFEELLMESLRHHGVNDTTKLLVKEYYDSSMMYIFSVIVNMVAQPEFARFAPALFRSLIAFTNDLYKALGLVNDIVDEDTRRIYVTEFVKVFNESCNMSEEEDIWGDCESVRYLAQRIPAVAGRL